MARGATDPAKVAKAHSVFVRLTLPPYTIHFKSPTYIQPSTLDLLDKKVTKETLKSTAQSSAIREAIGKDAKFWQELEGLLKAAIPSLERRSFSVWDPSAVDYESTSGALIAGHYPALWRDLERLNDLVSIARNLLTIGQVAQDLAASYGLETQLFRLINCCVRVTARGYDGEAGTGEEEKWQWVVNAYKKCLITGLQVLNNFVAQNEGRKLGLWMGLFGEASEDKEKGGGVEKRQDHEKAMEPVRVPPPPPTSKPEPPVNTNDVLLAYGTTGPSQRLSPLELEAAQALQPHLGFAPIPPQAEAVLEKKKYEANAWVYFVSQHKAQCIQEFRSKHKRAPMLGEISKNMPRYWLLRIRRGEIQNDAQWEEWQQKYVDAVEKYRRDLEAWQNATDSATLLPSPPAPKAVEPPRLPPSNKDPEKADPEDNLEARIKTLEQQLSAHYASNSTSNGNSLLAVPFKLRESTGPDDPSEPLLDPAKLGPGERNDLKMLFTAEAGAKILESGKIELMKRLEGSYHHHHHHAHHHHHHHHATNAHEGGVGVGVGHGRRMSLPIGARERGNRYGYDPVTGDRALRLEPLESQLALVDTNDAIDDSFAPEESVDEDEEEDESEEGEEEEDGSEEEEDDEDEDYPGSTEDGRGLLTDVPLILGPSEIEVLPMLIMSGLVKTTTKPESQWIENGENHYTGKDRRDLINAHMLRTHLLLSQPTGRNLLRELLIFVAAWDLREEELYFKFMVKIMEAILKQGLMPYAYHAFRDRSRSKDIISPAQAVMIKLLTGIWRSRIQSAKAAISSTLNSAEETVAAGKPLKRVRYVEGVPPMTTLQFLTHYEHNPTLIDLHALNFIFTEFRQHIIPQTCALIFLQGQIHRGRADREDFPLNLWDMERMYEGVYQFLEFFAVLTEEGGASAASGWNEVMASRKESKELAPIWNWKDILADWEMAAELVTLLRELEGGIPKLGGLEQQVSLPPKRVQQQQHAALPAGPGSQQRSLSADAAYTTPVSVERPFDLDDTLPPLPLQSQHSQLFEPETPLAYPVDDPLASYPTHAGAGGTLSHDQDEPSDFEWRNLKKLTVLVLSSLLYTNTSVQEQVRRCGGLEALVSCCKHDEHNPFIREHAVMCLRFAVEGNEVNRKVIEGMVESDPGRRVVGPVVVGGGPFGQGGRIIGRRGGDAVGGVPSEVLDMDAYETYMDGNGQIGLRSKSSSDRTGARPTTTTTTTTSSSLPVVPSSSSSSTTTATAKPRLSATKMTAEKAAELMQNALRDLPMGDKLVTNKQKAEALARLDRAFESTEKALGRGVGSSGGSGSGGKKG